MPSLLTNNATVFVVSVGLVVLSHQSLQAQKAETPDPYQRSNLPRLPESKLSADDCLAVAKDWLEQERFDLARIWYRAAQNRTEDPQLRNSAKRQLYRLKLLGKPAPKLKLDRWIHGRDRRRLSDKIRGRVVLLNFFQFACPESHHAMNDVTAIADRHRKQGLTVISIAVVLGQEVYQQPDMIKQYVTEHNVNHRVGLDAQQFGTFQVYQGTKTPFTALIDRDGRVRWLGRFERETVEHKALKLLAEKVGHKLPGRRIIMPMSRGGRDRIEKHAPRLKGEVWLNTRRGRPPKLLGRPRFIRFLTKNCAYCRASAPALNQLHRDYSAKGLAVVGIYHPKPRPRDVTFEEFRSAVSQLELQFPVTVDADWEYLDKIWRDSGDRDYTSVSFLIDRKGVIRYVHPGPEFFPSDDPAKAQQNGDYLAIRRAIEKVLSE